MATANFSYEYPEKQIGKPPALEKDIRLSTSLTWVSEAYAGVSTNPLTVFTSRELSVEEKAQLDAFVDSYVDPSVFLIYNRTENCPMITAYYNSSKLAVVDGKKVMQNFIFVNQNQPDQVLDAIKTIVEYRCDDVTLFSQEPNNRSFTIEIYDKTRDVIITSLNVNLAEIADAWDQQAIDSPNTPGADWRSLMFTGLHNRTTDYDCIWQLRVSVSNPTFYVGLGSMQNIFYDVL